MIQNVFRIYLMNVQFFPGHFGAILLPLFDTA
jgi:hypothetical protein